MIGANVSAFSIGKAVGRGAKNLDPVITSSPVTTGTQGVAYSYQVQATDPEGGSLTYTLPTKPSGMTISGSGLIAWTPSSVGSESVVVRVTDNKGAFAEQSYSIAVAQLVFSLSYALVAGGGGGSTGSNSGGGGAGGMLEGSQTIQGGTAYSVYIGGGGGTYSNGGNSTFSTVVATGGGRGSGSGNGYNGGSGGGAAYNGSQGGTGISGQGNNGGAGAYAAPYYGAGGGGGKGSVGGSGSGYSGGQGGTGKQITLNGTNVKDVAGGGGGGVSQTGGGSASSGGGSGGGTNGAQAATANTGGGGGGGGWPNTSGGAGGSGLIAISYPSNVQATFSAGVTSTTSTVGAYKITQITAAGPSDTVTFG